MNSGEFAVTRRYTRILPLLTETKKWGLLCRLFAKKEMRILMISSATTVGLGIQFLNLHSLRCIQPEYTQALITASIYFFSKFVFQQYILVSGNMSLINTDSLTDILDTPATISNKDPDNNVATEILYNVSGVLGGTPAFASLRLMHLSEIVNLQVPQQSTWCPINKTIFRVGGII